MNIGNMRSNFINNPMSYREKLTIPRDIRFGLEIELNNVDYKSISQMFYRDFGNKWSVVEDSSLNLKNSAEIVSPILTNNRKTWFMLKNVGNFIQNIEHSCENCSFQVNFDLALLKSYKQLILFLKLFAKYEDIIYRFSKGEDDKYRKSIETYAYPISLMLKEYLNNNDEEGFLNSITNHKRYGVAFKTRYKKLIEFRTPNGTDNIVLWQNYITTFYYMLEYVSKDKCNEYDLNQYIKDFDTIYMLKKYEELNVEKAIEFANKIFSKNEDTSYFLQQYIGKDSKTLSL